MRKRLIIKFQVVAYRFILSVLCASLSGSHGWAQAVITTTNSFISRSYILNPTQTGHGPHCFKIATLYPNNVGDDDHLHLSVNLNTTWAASANATIDALFGNRGGFTYTYTSRGVQSSSTAKLAAYSNTDSSVDVYLVFADVYATASYSVLEVTEDNVYATPTDLGAATPPGTLVFDSSSPSYPPSMFQPFSGNLGIGTTSPSQMLSVAGNIAGGGSNTGLILRSTTTAVNGNTIVDPRLLMDGVYSGNGTSATPWGLNFVSVPWTWGQDPMTYHAGFHDFRVIVGNTAERDVAQITSGGIVFPAGNGATITYSDGTAQTTAWNGVLPGGDYAESVDVSGDTMKYEPGDVLTVDPGAEGRFLRSAQPYSTSVTGVYSTRPGVVGRRQKTDASHMKQEIPMAMTGIVPTKVSAENGPIKPGDLLVTATKSGYAMKGTDRTQMLGAVIGKALGHLDSGTGIIEVVISLQ